MFAFNLLSILYHGKSTGMKNQTRHSITAENAERRGSNVPVLPLFRDSQHHFCKLVRLSERASETDSVLPKRNSGEAQFGLKNILRIEPDLQIVNIFVMTIIREFTINKW